MAWTLPTGIFFASIAVGLVSLTVFERLKPTVQRRGFLRIATTRGDRVFISLLSSAYIHLLWLAFLSAPLWLASMCAVVIAALILRYG